MEETKEVWRDIQSYKGEYQISNLGRVKSLNYKGNVGKEKIKIAEVNHIGYFRIALSHHGKNKHFMVHRLVADSFISNPFHKLQVNHIDGDKQNNNVINLEWVTQSENMLHSYRIGLRTGMKGSKHPMKGKTGKLNHCSKKIICITTGKQFNAINDAERQYGVSHTTISRCCKGKQKFAGKSDNGSKLVWRYLEEYKSQQSTLTI